jgi:hypothetical protein
VSPRERRDRLLQAVEVLLAGRVRHPNRRPGPPTRRAIKRARRLHPGKAAK